ncbi:MAG: hypothetical protein QM692_15680 [Thermomicrobiales bacterium]
MSADVGDRRDVQFAYACSVVRHLDPTATDAAIQRYLTEIDIMAQALATLEIPVASEPAAFDATWPDGDDA